ncbi:MAG: prepilin-type N-terminal cleavage/methylation domain-containing protein [Phycisphaerales bacterium]|jgi:prepilin-type N-terminal cleavage/methylation domain-containing protein|nr:prepilin-type N-terminal cleavage/methylation domain-containing protein [Phycisphaerales bacterium]
MTRHRGFTLIEVLVALGITVVLVGALGLFVDQISSSRSRIRDRSTREAAATTILDAIDDALGTCIARQGDGTSGVVGDELSIEIAFDTTTVQRALGGSPEAVLVPGDRIAIEFSPGSGRLALARDGDSMHELETGFFAMRLRYHDGRDWLPRWDALEMGGLPWAVECSIWFTPWPDDVVPEWFPEGFNDVEDPPSRAVEELAEPVDPDELRELFGSDRDSIDPALNDGLPQPDRRRVFAIPDAEQPDESTFFEEPLFQRSFDSGGLLEDDQRREPGDDA